MIRLTVNLTILSTIYRQTDMPGCLQRDRSIRCPGRQTNFNEVRYICEPNISLAFIFIPTSNKRPFPIWTHFRRQKKITLSGQRLQAASFNLINGPKHRVRPDRHFQSFNNVSINSFN